jgi:hypothetical protein
MGWSLCTAVSNNENSSRQIMHRLAWILGLIGVPLSHYWLIARAEPFYSLIYCFLWWSYIFAADFFVFKLRGKSILRDRPWEFVVLWFWSIPLWMFFEVINRRIENWYYIMAPTNLLIGLVYLVFAFGAVLPGVFVTVELIVGLIEKFSPTGKITGPPFRVHPWNIRIQLLIGALMLIFLLLFPGSCFAFAWGFAFFGIDPICYWLYRRESNHIGRSLLGQMAAGDNTRFVAILLAGFVCGGLWEGWNIDARTKWVYSVPYFDEFKLGEMPLLGFLGFPPFALECYALINLLTWFRGGRTWEFTDARNASLSGMSGKLLITLTLLLPLFFAFAAYATLRNVATFAEPLHWQIDLTATEIEALRKRHALQAHQFLKLQNRPSEIAESLWLRLRRLALLSELKGMGLENALGLEKLQITTLNLLAQQDPDLLAKKLQEQGLRTRPREVKVWILAARKASRQ